MLGVLATAINGCAALARSKATALNLGPQGVGLIAEIQQLLTLLSVPAAALTGAALTRRLVAARQSGGMTEFREQTRSAATTTLLVTLLAAFAGAICGPFVLEVSFSELAPIIGLAGLAAAAAATLGVYAQTLLVTGDLQRAFTATSINTLLGAALAVVGLLAFGLAGFFVGPLIAAVVAFVVAVNFARKSVIDGSWWPVLRVDPVFIQMAIRLGGASLVGTFLVQLSLSTIRLSLGKVGGHSLNGVFQAAWALDSLFMSALTSGLASYFFPRFAAATSPEALQSEVDRALKFAMVIGPPAILLLTASRSFAVAIAYSSDFHEAASLLGLFAVGNMLRLVGWVYAGPLLYRDKVRAFLVGDVTAAAILGGVSFLLVPKLGLVAVGIAQIAMYVVYLLVTRYQARQALGLKTHWASALIALALATLTLGLWFITEQWPWAWWAAAVVSLVAGISSGAHRQLLMLVRRPR